MDPIVVCSDCETELVAESELAAAEAFYAERHVSAGPYRGSAPKPLVKASPREQSKHDIATGIALLGAGVLFSAISFLWALGPSHSNRYYIALGPIAYGAYRLNRGLSSRP